jgi:hypothetical protein
LSEACSILIRIININLPQDWDIGSTWNVMPVNPKISSF